MSKHTPLNRVQVTILVTRVFRRSNLILTVYIWMLGIYSYFFKFLTTLFINAIGNSQIVSTQVLCLKICIYLFICIYLKNVYKTATVLISYKCPTSKYRLLKY